MTPNAPPKPRALVVEDDRPLADIIRLAFARAGYEVTVFHDGAQALEFAQSTPCDVIASDYQLPGLHGEQVLSAVRASGASQQAVLILCSAKAYELDSERLRNELGLAAVFFKPFSLNELVTVVNEARNAGTAVSV